MTHPNPRSCPVCVQAPCVCPDFADESDEERAQDDERFIRRLMAAYELAQ